MIVLFWDKSVMPRPVYPFTRKPQTLTRYLGGGSAKLQNAVRQAEFLAEGNEKQAAFDEFLENINYGADRFLIDLRLNGQEKTYLCKISDIDIKQDYPTLSNITATLTVLPVEYSINANGEYVVDDTYNTPTIITI
ncbi:MAG: hypothetical protein PHE73_03625 [Sulfurovaceae bacterium]|nr:hypothetical protein [Sulfurovaceae bacterium]